LKKQKYNSVSQAKIPFETKLVEPLPKSGIMELFPKTEILKKPL
jgi:hypothetical protein